MKKSIILLSILFIANFSEAFAQFDTINFSEFKLPDLKRQSLDFGFDINNEYTNYHRTDTSQNGNFNSFKLKNNFATRYSHYRNTRKYQGEHSINININANFRNYHIDSNKPENLNYKSKKISDSIFIHTNNKFYFKNNFFFGIGFGIFSNIMYYHKNEANIISGIQNISINSSILFKNDIYSKVSVGKGRIEPVEDYIQAIYILKELEKEGRSPKTTTKTKLIELTKLISQLKNKRFLDSRHKAIYELEQIDSFLQINNLISKNDIRYFTSINDNWLYAGNQKRFSGNSFNIYFTPNYSKLRLKDKYDTTNHLYTSKSFSLYSGITFSSYKNINLYWQRHFNINIYSSFSEESSCADSLCNTQLLKNFGIDVNYGYDYYPNTRTNFNFYITSGYKNIYENDIIYNSENTKITPYVNFNVDAYYYFSPQLRLTITSNGEYRHYSHSLNNLQTKRFYYTFLAGFQYSLF